MRKAFDAVYGGSGMPYAFSYANEVVTKGLSIFRMVKGDPKEAIIAPVNIGDTDCLAAVAGGGRCSGRCRVRHGKWRCCRSPPV